MNALFLCTGNSARSILGEGLLNDLSPDWTAYSAGSQPTGTPNPLALQTLSDHGHGTGFARSKSWEEFAGPDAPKMDLIFTVCDSAAAETCPVWPGHPATAHWGIPDPAAATGTEDERRAAFETAYQRMRQRIVAFLALPTGSIADQLPAIRAIGQQDDV